jgi:hypothetical protein
MTSEKNTVMYKKVPAASVPFFENALVAGEKYGHILTE